MTFPTGWGRKAPIVINAATADIADFVVHLDADCFPDEALDSADGNKANADGSDLRFTSDEAGTTELPFDVDRWTQHATAGSRRANVHVLVSALTFDSTTTIWVWYKNASASMPAATDANGSQAVWASFVGVWHANSNSSIPNRTGGTAATIEGSPASPTTESPMGLALDFDASNDALNFDTTNYSDNTVSVVLKHDSTSDCIIAGKGTLGLDAEWTTRVISGKAGFYYDVDGGGLYGYGPYSGSANVSTSDWAVWQFRNRSSNGGTIVSKALPTNEQSHAAHCNDGTYLYVIGGWTVTSSTPTTTHNRYSPSGDSWSSMAALPAPLTGHAAVYLGGKIYVFGGITTSSVSNTTTYIYDIAGDSWTTGASLPSSLTASFTQGHAACTDGTDIFVFMSTKMERYNVAANTWTSRADCPIDQASYSSIIYDGGYIYIIGGAGTNFDDVQRYSVSGNSWTSFYDTAPYGAWAHICEPAGSGQWFVGFGRVGSGSEQSRRLYLYTPSTATWDRLQDYDLQTTASAAMVYGGKLHVYGWWTVGTSETYSKGHHAAFDISGGAWDTLPPVVELLVSGQGQAGIILSSRPYQGPGKFSVGRLDGYSSLYSGAKVAAVRRSSSTRSKAWLLAEAQTLLTPSAFAIVGSAQAASSMPSLTAITASNITTSGWRATLTAA